MGHTFIERCYVLENLIPFMYVDTIAFFVMFLVWLLFVTNLRKEQSFPVQRILSMIPFLKALENFLYAMDF